MNKYIRTKGNKILKVLDMEFACGVKVYYTESGYISERIVLKEADTIKELCDYFYWDWEDGFSIHNFMNYSIAKNTWDEYVNDCLEDNEKPDRNMYGCIKTDKGLISAAKMNEEGDLEAI